LQPDSQRADRQQWLADSLQERIKKGNLRIAIEYALEYTRQEHSVEHTLDQIVQIQKLLPNKDNLLERLLPLCHDSVILSRDSYLNLRIAQENLDSLIGKMGQDPNNFQDRLMLADNSFANKNWHGAVVEYARCLGIHEDAAVQAKLLSARKLSKNVDQPDNSLLEKQIDLTIRDLKLKTEAFGSDSGQAMNDRQNLGRLYLNNEELPKAEALLTQVANWSLKSKPQTASNGLRCRRQVSPG
jgi:hypothetical protein